jgi:Resolvase, N terminal domain
MAYLRYNRDGRRRLKHSSGSGVLTTRKMELDERIPPAQFHACERMQGVGSPVRACITMTPIGPAVMHRGESMQAKEHNKRVAVYRNEGDSSSLERPSLHRLRKAIRNREMDVVVAAHFHFLASKPEHLALLYQEMAAHDVELISAGEGPFAETVQGQLLSGKSKSEVIASLVEKGKRVGERSPMDERIDGYCFGVLAPQLQRYGVEQHGIDRIVADSNSRLHGILSRWHDEDWRDTLLEMGREEGIFFLPADTPLAIRSLVVVAIRNSLLEDWHVKREYGGQGRKIDDIRMRWITAEAIRYFDACALSTLPDASFFPENPFAELEQQFPLAWHIFSLFAEAGREEEEQRKRSKKGLAFRVDLPKLSALPGLPEDISRVRATRDTMEGGLWQAVVGSGISPHFDDRLLALLFRARNEQGMPWYSDS